MNNNFNYLDGRITTVGTDISTLQSNLATVNTNVNNRIDAIDTRIDTLAYRHIGEIVMSTIPLTDAGLHLLNGTLISGSGSYSDFVDYIADLYDSGDYTAIFETEANWQAAVTANGVCGKFVYDSVNNTVRLPKYNSKIYTGGGTTPIVGNGNALGLTNGTNDYYLAKDGNPGNYYAFSNSPTGGVVGTSVSFTAAMQTAGSNVLYGVSTDGTKSGVIADLANITTSLDGYYYIVIATSTKTQIEVDIDEIATDLNGKADVDLSNCTRPHIIETYQDGESGYIIYSNKLCEEWGHNTSGVTINFYNTFADTNYNIQMVEGGGGAIGTNSNNQVIQTVSTTGFKFNAQRANYYWRVIGYIS